LYNPDSDGEFVTHIVGGMTLDKCVVNVGVEKSQLIFTDNNSKMSATFDFVRYNDKSQYPAFKCESVDILIDGINVDFENMYPEDKDKFSRFIIELMPRMQEMGIVVSVDVTAPDGDPNWSLCYDRHVIGDVADYLVFMAYDQYGVSSSKPGTTAGFNWVETNLKKIIEYDEVDTEKIILGMPFYTRQWTVASDGTIKGKPVVSMMNIKIPNNVEKQWDDDLKQYYIEYKSGKNTIKMWIEDGTSIKEKVSLVTKYNLGGTSCWRKDMETSNVWTIIREELEK